MEKEYNPFEKIYIELENIKQLLEQQQIKSTKVDENNDDEVFLTRKEVASWLKISLVTLNEWTSSGILTAYKIGTRVRFRKSDVLDALQKKNSYKF